MKKSIVVIAIASALFGCSSPNYTPTPSSAPSSVVSPSEANTEPSTVPSTRPPVQPSTRQATRKAPSPSSSPTDEGAAPLATQFAQRWGKTYPDVPEYKILRAANDTCKLISMSGNDWAHDPQIKAGLEAIVDKAGMHKSDADEFAQDADQNYCASVANPT